MYFDPETFVTSLSTNLATNYSIKLLDQTLCNIKEIITNYLNKSNANKKEIIDIVNGIILSAGKGYIEIENIIMNSIDSAIKSNHQDGFIKVFQTNILAKEINIGGEENSCGSTVIMGSQLETDKSSIRMGEKAFIKMEGNASIKLS